MNNTHHTRSSDVLEVNPNLSSLVAGGAGRGSESVHQLMQSDIGSHLCQSGNDLPSEIRMSKRAVLNTSEIDKIGHVDRSRNSRTII